MPEFDECYAVLRAHHRRARPRAGDARRDARARALERDRRGEGLPDPDRRRSRGASGRRRRSSRAAARAELGLPADAFVVGSFQKDGVGWGEGDEPKAIKGPDVLLDALVACARACSRSCTCCSPGRRAASSGAASNELGIPYVHRVLERYEEIALPLRGPRRLRRPVAPGGRAEGRARGDGERRAGRDDARRAGAGARRGRRQRAGSSTSRTPRRSQTAIVAAAGSKELVAAGLRDGRGERLLRPARRSGGGSSTASSSMRERVPWAVRAPGAAGTERASRRLRLVLGELPRLARDRSNAAASRGDGGLLRLRADARPGRRRLRRLRQVLAARASRSRTRRATSTSSTSARAACRSTRGRSRGSHRRRGAAFVWNQNGVAYPGLVRRRLGAREPAARAPAPRRRPRRLPERRSAS